MIFYLLIIIIVVSAAILLSFNSFFASKLKNNNFKLKTTLVILTTLSTTMLYFHLSNYWIGRSILEKIKTHTNVENREANEIAIVKEAMINLEKELIENPNSLEKILELAQTKFLLGYLEDSLELYKKARSLSPKSIDIMKAEAQVRVLIESFSLSQETISLLSNIISIEPENILALYILGNYEYENKNFYKAKKMFQVLKKLLNENTEEYNEINDKIMKMEKGYEK